jgi:hypothetical protein
MTLAALAREKRTVRRLTGVEGEDFDPGVEIPDQVPPAAREASETVRQG